jgi:hypothetical protein
MFHNSAEQVDNAVRSAVAEKVRHIINSNNGHMLSKDAVNVVKELQRQRGF